ncbi:MAG: indole-3-glycerol phosphate synthase TrpC [Pontiellaceae bacterium]|nr:indole-3-glycerol phosphate synthase TrpC [Pontiellaceae bacterium]MBN2783352.1 indole-3-glycerol phosphate synthase TrpC [Pontiellaceae bacterium]
MSNILEQIIADKRIEIEQRKLECSFRTLEARCAEAPVRPDFVQSLRSVPMGLIAEVKRRSPSAGMIRDPFDPAEIARSYQVNGASAISCLMDEKYFGGGAGDFAEVREAVELPMLYKEFVVDSWQILHAKATGASAVLLIVGALTDEELTAFIGEIGHVGLQPLVEVHDAEEMRRAIDCGADIIGINNRNLKTFETRLETTFALASMAPASCTLVSESGIRTAGDVVRLQDAGAHAILVGESLLREEDPGRAAARLMAEVRSL